MSNENRRLTDHYSLDPDEQVGHLEPGADPATATASGTRYRDIYGASLIHRPHDLWVALEDKGRHLQNLIRQRLLAERFSADDADEWGFRNWRWYFGDPFRRDADDEWLTAAVVEQALTFRDTGIPNDEAFEWVKRHKNADDAVWLRSHGWNSGAHSALVAACLPFAPPAEDPRVWVQAPIAWWRALRYLQAGLRLPEALDQEERRHAGEDIDAAIDLLLGLAARRRP